MIKAKVYDKITDKLIAEKVFKNRLEYRLFLCEQIDHTTQYVFGVRV